MDGQKTINERFDDFKRKVRWKWEDVKKWCRDNPGAAVTIATVSIPAAAKISSSVISAHKHSEDERHRNRSVYDPVHHHSYEAKRDIKPSEWSEIDRRKDAGESVYWILQDLNLL